MDQNAKKKGSKLFLPLARKVKVMFPNLERELLQSEMDYDPIIFLSYTLKKSIISSSTFGLLLVFMGYYIDSFQFMLLGLGIWPVIFLFSLFSFAKIPSIKEKKKKRRLDKELPYALRHILVESKAGVSLFNAMASVTEGYGEASKEFKKIVDEVNTGTSEEKALENAIMRNPSMKFRRSLWQISNSIKAGANVSKTLETLVDSIFEDQLMQVRKYGKELNPYTLVYMMVSVIIPSLGITFMMILSSFTGMAISDWMFYAIIIGLIAFQYFFINFVKSKRPNIKA